MENTMIEELNRVLEDKDVYLDSFKSDYNEWTIYNREDDQPCGIFYISPNGQYEFNLARNFKNRNLLQEIKKEIARVVSYYDDYSN